MKVAIVTLFPDMFTALTEFGVSRRALEKKLLAIKFWNPRDFTSDAHRTVDGRPYGGGPGMVISVEPVVRCVESLVSKKFELSILWHKFRIQIHHNNRMNHSDVLTCEMPLIQIRHLSFPPTTRIHRNPRVLCQHKGPMHTIQGKAAML